MTRRPLPTRPSLTAALVLAAALVQGAVSAQTQIKLDRNKYTPAQDVQIGQEVAGEVRREMPMLNDERIESYVERVGERLVEAIPPQFRQAEFRYSFDVVNQREINAFALPGGPMFLNRGMIEAAKSEGEMAGVMAHEISHVVLRHGTAQATKASRFQIGALIGQITGAIVGGAAGSVIAQGSQFGLGTYFLKFGREYERQSDLLGAQILARAGYDPRRMADMFRTIQQQSKGSGPEWLSSHPNPSNRYEAINREAAQLRIEGNPPNEAGFNDAQARLRAMAPAYTAQQIAQAKERGERLPGTGGGSGDSAPIRDRNVRIAPPSTQYQNETVGNIVRVQVPANWQRSNGSDSVTFAPDGGRYRTGSGSTGFTHGAQVGVARTQSRAHGQATEELIAGLQQGNPRMQRQSSGLLREFLDGREALSTTLRNVSEVTGGVELVGLTTVSLRDGSLMYLIMVAAQEDADDYATAFRRLKQTIQFTDR